MLVTDHQTAGRGRQNRNWHDEPGNALLVSLLLRPKLAVAPLMPLLTGIAAVEAVHTLLPAEDQTAELGPVVGLKWPNDVLAPQLDERKVAGILAESSTSTPTAMSGEDDSIVVVVGMGLNLRWGSPPPDEIAARAATLSEVLGREVERIEVLHRYLRAFEHWLGQLEQHGAAALLDRYRSHCLTIGRSVRFATAATEHHGTVVDVSPSGTLLLETVDGVVELHAGDAHHIPIE